VFLNREGSFGALGRVHAVKAERPLSVQSGDLRVFRAEATAQWQAAVRPNENGVQHQFFPFSRYRDNAVRRFDH